MARGKWNEFLILYRTERKQVLAVIALVCLLLAIKFSIPYWYQPDIPSLDELEGQLVFHISGTPQVSDAYIDINTDSISDWQLLGFSEKQAQVVVNFKKSRGGFSTKEELLDCYIIDSAVFVRIAGNLMLSQPTQEILEKDFESAHPKLNLTALDPNLVSREELLAMGISPGLVKNWVNYRQKVGRFDSTGELKRLYAMDDSTFEEIAPFVSIQPLSTAVEEVPQALDLNRCDSMDLLALPGIGPYYAHLILSYRNRLGGFVHVDQLHEIKKIPVSTLNDVAMQIELDSSFQVRKLNLNSDDFRTFLMHPYFSFYNTKKLFQFKDKEGKFTSLHDLKKGGFH